MAHTTIFTYTLGQYPLFYLITGQRKERKRYLTLWEVKKYLDKGADLIRV